MKKTAIDWIVEKVNADCLNSTYINNDLVKEAKAMEKEQIIEAHYRGGCDFQEANECRNQEVPYGNDAEQYYNLTYKGVKNA
jgi:hypothetical protein